MRHVKSNGSDRGTWVSSKLLRAGLRRQRTQTIGVITEDLEQFTTPEIVEGIMKYCEEKSIVSFCRILGCIQDGKINGTMMKR